MTLQELLDMPLLERKDLCSGTIVRVPGGWLFDRSFVPEPLPIANDVRILSSPKKFDIDDMANAFNHALGAGSDFAEGTNDFGVFLKQRYNIDL